MLALFVLLAACSGAEAGDAPAGRPPVLTAYVFAPPGCGGCEIIERDILPSIARQYGDAVGCVLVRVEDEEDLRLLFLYEKRYGVTSNESVKAFVGTQCLKGVKELHARIESAIEEELLKGIDSPTPDEMLASAGGGDVVADRYAAFTPAAVAAAGLFDGINPCAFVTLAFFLSVLALLKKEKREILMVGLAFSAAVFLTYLFLGVTIFEAIRRLSAGLGNSSVITRAAGGFALVMGVLSLADAVRYLRTSDAAGIRLKLPDALRKAINRLIHERMNTAHVAAWAAALGVAVTLLESVCTGQIYLPVIADVIRRKGLLTDALPLLILYNVMFVLPILVVFGLAWAGTGSRRISSFFSSHVSLSKALMAAVFIFFGIRLLFQ